MPKRPGGERPASFWEEVRQVYVANEKTLREIQQDFELTPGEFDYARQQLGWPRRRTPVATRKQLIRRLFKMLDRMLTKLETEMITAGEKEVAVLGRLVHSMSKLIAIEGTAGTKATPRETREMDDIRRKLVARIDELKRE